MSIGARAFVAFVFFVLGVSFLATTGALIYEFRTTEWFALAAFYSHLFVFFPTFGIVALAAFYLPTSAFTDLYWHHIPYGRLRFVVGFLAIAAASYGISWVLLQGTERTIWEVKPQVLTEDRGEPPGCEDGGTRCRRLPVLSALRNVRVVSGGRTGLSAFARDCEPDPFLEPPAELAARRFCFVTDRLPPNRATFSTAAQCCQAQKRFVRFLSSAYERKPENRSLTGLVHNNLLPLKVFFLLVLLIVGILLAVRRKAVLEHYKDKVRRIERCVLIGAFAMLFWPIMNHAFLQSAAVLYGNTGNSVFRYLGPGFSIIFGAWGLLLLFFFYHRYEKSLEAVGKIAGVVASAVAVLKYDLIVDYFVRFAGSGATVVTFAVLGSIGLLALVNLFVRIGGDSAEFAESLAGGNVAQASVPERTENRYRSDDRGGQTPSET